jgi:hypothetical protein
MRKTINVLVLFLFILGFSTCSNEGTPESQDFLSIQERYEITKEIASYHSDGLDFAYNKLMEIRKNEELNPSKVFFRNESKEEKMILINTIVNDFVLQEKVVSNLAKYNNKINLGKFKKTDFNQVNLRSENGLELGSDVIKLLSFFDSIVDSTVETGEPVIELAVRSEKFASFSEDEQNKLLMMFAVFEDSSKYWEEKTGSWEELLGEENIEGKLRSSRPQPYNTWKADGAGALGGLIGGALEGAISGSIYYLITTIAPSTSDPFSSQGIVSDYLSTIYASYGESIE